MNTVPKPGEFYRHFKNKLYQIIAIANHSETGEKMVVYQALYGDYSIWVRPLSMFMEEVDREKYPDAAQQYRFEQVNLQQPEEQQEILQNSVSEQDKANPLLLEFLDAETFETRMAVLQKMKTRASQRDVDSLCLCLDAKPSKGTIEEQIEDLMQYLKMQQRYDASRLRRGQ